MARNVSFEEFRGDLTEEELSTLIKLAKKRRTIYLIGHLCCFALAMLVSLITQWISITESSYMVIYIMSMIPALAMGIFAGFGCWTHNVLCFMTSRGRRDGGGITSIIWALFGGIIIPLIVIFVCKNMFPYKSILGWGKTGITFTNDNRL